MRRKPHLGVAKLNLARTEVRSPVNGYVTNLLFHRGDYATAGRAALAIVDSDSYYVAGYFEETKLRHIKIGDAVSVRLLGFGAPDRTAMCRAWRAPSPTATTPPAAT